MLGAALILLLACFPLSSADKQPEYPPDDSSSLDRFHLAKPYTRWGNKYHPLGSVLATMSEVRLTPDAKSSAGAIWSREAIGLEAFSVEARIRLSAAATSMVADGVGIWFAETKGVGSAYGNAELFTGFGLVLDIYDNTHSFRTPMLQLLASNGTQAVSSDQNGEEHRLQSCKLLSPSSFVHQGFDHNARESLTVLIEYTPGKIRVYYKFVTDTDWQFCLTHDNVYIPTYFYLGASASTGDVTAQQDILSLKVFPITLDPSVKREQPARDGMYYEPKTEEAKRAEETKPASLVTTFNMVFFTLAFFVVVGCLVLIIKPDLFPGTQASIDKKKRFY